MDKKPFYTTAELGKEIDITAQGIATLIRMGKIKADKVNNSYIIMYEEAKKFLESRGKKC